MKRQDALTQVQVLDILRQEGLGAGIATGTGTISAFVDIPMYSAVAFRQENNKWGGFYDRNEVRKFISDYRYAKQHPTQDGNKGFESK